MDNDTNTMNTSELRILYAMLRKRDRQQKKQLDEYVQKVKQRFQEYESTIKALQEEIWHVHQHQSVLFPESSTSYGITPTSKTTTTPIDVNDLWNFILSDSSYFGNQERDSGSAMDPDQVCGNPIDNDFEFTLMVVGESGVGKSTLIDSLFSSDYSATEYVSMSHNIKRTAEITRKQFIIQENSVRVVLTVVDTPGFTDTVDISNFAQPIIDYIDSKSEEYLSAENEIDGKNISDTRVHCCLYFIPSSVLGLRPVDVDVMKRLAEKVNIIPIISKADTMIPEEIGYLKKQILREIIQHNIKIYNFPSENLQEKLPFAVFGSCSMMEVDGKKVRGRKYPWGMAQIENPEHCEFLALRDMMTATHLRNLRDVTNMNYIHNKLDDTGITKRPHSLNKNSLEQKETLRKEKMEAGLVQVYESKFEEKKQKLKECEAGLRRKHERMKKEMDAELRDLIEKQRKLEAEEIQ